RLICQLPRSPHTNPSRLSYPPTPPSPLHVFFFFNDTATTEIYTLSLHDALPIRPAISSRSNGRLYFAAVCGKRGLSGGCLCGIRSEEHTSELQSLTNLVCRLLLEKKKITVGRCPQCPSCGRRSCCGCGLAVRDTP